MANERLARFDFTFHDNSIHVIRAMNDMNERQVYMAMSLYRNEVAQVLTGPRTGRVYRIPGTHKKYRASAPGEPPASRTGALRQSLRVVITRTPKGPRGELAMVRYGPWLEQGTAKMAARPFIRRVWHKLRPKIGRIMLTGRP